MRLSCAPSQIQGPGGKPCLKKKLQSLSILILSKHDRLALSLTSSEKGNYLIQIRCILMHKKSRYREERVYPEAYQMHQNIRSDNIFLRKIPVYRMKFG
jgi:hypothetical protein